MLFRSTFKSFLSILLISSCVHLASAQEEDASQLGFSGLQSRANALVEEGHLVEAMPLLKELVKRVEASKNSSDIALDFPIFLIGTGHIQQYLLTGQAAELNTALKWYDKLEKDYPNSPKLKDMLLKRIDVLRALNRNDDAITTMKSVLSGAYTSVHLNYSEQTKMLKDLTQVYYSTGQLAEGLPYFGQLLEVARDPEDQALAAAASFEALFQAKRIDDALRLLPLLAKESSIRYRPRLNVALLIASDTLVDAGRLNDAALTLNLIKTTDIMIEYHEQQVAEKTARMEQRIAFGNAEQEVEKLQQEIKTLNTNLDHLRQLPSLRNELLVRRARNYTKTARRYEAFWMFYDLMEENPDDPQAEFYHYATFSNALQIKKSETAIEVGRIYRSKFPQGDYYSDVSAALAAELKKAGLDQEFLELAVNFLGERPQDAVSRSLFAQWASYLIERKQFAELITQAAEWYNAHKNSIYEDGIFYWGGLAELQMNQFEDAVGSFSRLVEQYPGSVYAEDGLLRKGAALFYAQRYEEARDTLYSYVKKYPAGQALDQAYFFLGEVEYLAGNMTLALKHFAQADTLTGSQDVHNGAAFRMGSIYEELGRYEEMASHFDAYIKRFGEDGDLTRAVLQLGLAYEHLMRPVEMLSLYRENIEKYADDPNNTGVDALIEGYAEKYTKNLTVLKRTVAFFDQLENDLEFRKKIVTDRGFLFEHFYVNPDLDQTLYNPLRNDPKFTSALMEDLSPIDHLMAPYKTQLSAYPQETPEDYFRDLLAKARAKDDIISETRMLMGLYRLEIELAPSRPFDNELVNQLTPRAILYIADYERAKRLEFAENAWNLVLQKYSTDDAAIVAYMRLADIAAEKGRPSDALNYLDQIVTQFPGSPKVPAVILRQGELLSQMGRGIDARKKYQYMLRVPEWRGVLQARALYQIGHSYMEESAYAEAHGFFERTFLGYPHLAEWSSRAYLADAEALLAMGEKQDAINTLTEATQELSESAPADILTAIQAKLKELQP
jgi:TolA-binding protein